MWGTPDEDAIRRDARSLLFRKVHGTSLAAPKPSPYAAVDDDPTTTRRKGAGTSYDPVRLVPGGKGSENDDDDDDGGAGLDDRTSSVRSATSVKKKKVYIDPVPVVCPVPVTFVDLPAGLALLFDVASSDEFMGRPPVASDPFGINRSSAAKKKFQFKLRKVKTPGEIAAEQLEAAKSDRVSAKAKRKHHEDGEGAAQEDGDAKEEGAAAEGEKKPPEAAAAAAEDGRDAAAASDAPNTTGGATDGSNETAPVASQNAAGEGPAQSDGEEAAPLGPPDSLLFLLTMLATPPGPEDRCVYLYETGRARHERIKQQDLERAKKLREAEDAECTFQPKLSQLAEGMKRQGGDASTATAEAVTKAGLPLAHFHKVGVEWAQQRAIKLEKKKTLAQKEFTDEKMIAWKMNPVSMRITDRLQTRRSRSAGGRSSSSQGGGEREASDGGGEGDAAASLPEEEKKRLAKIELARHQRQVAALLTQSDACSLGPREEITSAAARARRSRSAVVQRTVLGTFVPAINPFDFVRRGRSTSSALSDTDASTGAARRDEGHDDDGAAEGHDNGKPLNEEATPQQGGSVTGGAAAATSSRRLPPPQTPQPRAGGPQASPSEGRRANVTLIFRAGAKAEAAGSTQTKRHPADDKHVAAPDASEVDGTTDATASQPRYHSPSAAVTPSPAPRGGGGAKPAAGAAAGDLPLAERMELPIVDRLVTDIEGRRQRQIEREQLYRKKLKEKLYDRTTGQPLFEPNALPTIVRNDGTRIPLDKLPAKERAETLRKWRTWKHVDVGAQVWKHAARSKSPADGSGNRGPRTMDEIVAKLMDKQFSSKNKVEKIRTRERKELKDLFHPKLEQKSIEMTSSDPDRLPIYQQPLPTKPSKEEEEARKPKPRKSDAAAIEGMLQRTKQWLQTRHNQLQRKATSIEREEMAECVFAPSVTAESARICQERQARLLVELEQFESRERSRSHSKVPGISAGGEVYLASDGSAWRGQDDDDVPEDEAEEQDEGIYAAPPPFPPPKSGERPKPSSSYRHEAAIPTRDALWRDVGSALAAPLTLTLSSRSAEQRPRRHAADRGFVRSPSAMVADDKPLVDYRHDDVARRGVPGSPSSTAHAVVTLDDIIEATLTHLEREKRQEGTSNKKGTHPPPMGAVVDDRPIASSSYYGGPPISISSSHVVAPLNFSTLDDVHATDLAMAASPPFTGSSPGAAVPSRLSREGTSWPRKALLTGGIAASERHHHGGPSDDAAALHLLPSSSPPASRLEQLLSDDVIRNHPPYQSHHHPSDSAAAVSAVSSSRMGLADGHHAAAPMDETAGGASLTDLLLSWQALNDEVASALIF